MTNLMNNWEYRFLTPYGRSCIAKTLVIPKLTHISLAIPSLNKQILIKLDNLIYKFIWKGQDKTARACAKMEEHRGGLNFPDIESSWKAFKISWLRRLYYTERAGSWKSIFEELLFEGGYSRNIHQFLVNIADSPPKRNAKILKNDFWNECLSVLKPLMLEFRKKYPENILYGCFWGSHLFMRNNRPVCKNMYPAMARLFESPMELLTYRNGWEFLSAPAL